MLFNFETVIRLFQGSNMGIGLTTATKLADELVSMHSDRICIVEAMAYDSGKLEGYDKGYKAGKIDSSEYDRGYNDGSESMRANMDNSQDRAIRIEGKMVEMAKLAALAIYEQNPNSKIAGIRKLYQTSGLGLAKCRQIMEPYYS